jgi:hypothetical protein
LHPQVEKPKDMDKHSFEAIPACCPAIAKLATETIETRGFCEMAAESGNSPAAKEHQILEAFDQLPPHAGNSSRTSNQMTAASSPV